MARQCVDGQTQRNQIKKEDAASPTVTTESIFLACIVDAKEGKEVAVENPPNGCITDLLKNITTENGQKVHYVKVPKALYGMLQSALLFIKSCTRIQRIWGLK